jgi:hypothetical protein
MIVVSVYGTKNCYWNVIGSQPGRKMKDYELSSRLVCCISYLSVGIAWRKVPLDFARTISPGLVIFSKSPHCSRHACIGWAWQEIGWRKSLFVALCSYYKVRIRACALAQSYPDNDGGKWSKQRFLVSESTWENSEASRIFWDLCELFDRSTDT